MKQERYLYLILATSLILLLLNLNSYSVLEASEARYAEISREMFRSGNLKWAKELDKKELPYCAEIQSPLQSSDLQSQQLRLKIADQAFQNIVDSQDRQIYQSKYINHLTWKEIALSLGATDVNKEAAKLRQRFHRYRKSLLAEYERLLEQENIDYEGNDK